MTTGARYRRLERRYRRLLVLYPQAHRREHAEEMMGVLLAAAAGGPRERGFSPVIWAVRAGQDTADSADLIAGAVRIRGRLAVKRIKGSRLLCANVRDPRWSDALAVVSVVAPVLLIVAALAEFSIPQVAASSLTGHLHLRVEFSVSLSDLPLALGAPAIAWLVFLRRRRAAALAAAGVALGLIAAEAAPALHGYARPAVAFSILLAWTAAAALLLSPGPGRGLALLTRRGAALVAAGALILGGFSVGGSAWFRYSANPGVKFTRFNGEAAGLPADLLIAAALAGTALFCLRTPVGRRILALLAIPVIPYAFLWQEKLAGDLVGSFPGAQGPVPSSIPLLYLPPLTLACLIVAGTRLARRRACGRDRRMGSRTRHAGPQGAMSA